MSERILIIDDNIVNRNLLHVILKKNGYKLLEASDGEEGLEVCSHELPDLVLLDIIMPKKDGYEVCSELKAQERTKDIPIIFLSAKDDASDKIRGLELGAVDYITKPFDKGEVLARVRTQIKIHKLTKSLIEKQKKLEEDLKAAAQIQKSLIPSTYPETENFSFAWRFIPCEYSGGDIFNIHRLDENHLAVYVIDVSGHGVPSAMVTVSVTQSLLPNTGLILKKTATIPPYYTITPPVEVLNQLDQEYPMERFDKYFTIAYLIINTKTGQIRYSSAAHPMPVLIRSSGEIELPEKGGPIISMGDMIPFEEGEVNMKSGDRLYLYTDGIVEYSNDTGEQYGEERFHNELLKHRKAPLDTTCDRVIESLMSFGGHIKAQDDITLVALECIRIS